MSLTGCFFYYLISPEIRESLFYALHPLQLSAVSQDTGVPGLAREAAYELRIATPPAHEQIAVATFLDRETAKIDALVADYRTLIELLQEKRQAVISHAVTKGLDPTVPMKDSGVEWLGEVPEHWEVAPLKRCADVIDCKHHTVTFSDEGFPVVSIREIRNDEIVLDEAKRTSLEEWEYLREGRVPRHGDLVFCRNASVGAVGYVDSLPEFCLGQDVCMIRPSIAGRFWHYQLTSRDTRGQIEALLVGATIRRLNVEDVRGVIVVMPPTEEQIEISTQLDLETENLGFLLSDALEAITLLQERRTALISAAVTGKIDVRGLVAIPENELVRSCG
ncbi:MAG: restriction endonuclease subunit S [Gammaproteobacteria bacterium]|nr:restriction endonuclease subunit S [Gammaproteobacteria bacterium]